jgi:alkylation response protein AidB-like acyl-CoA dehydrogenase
VSLMLAAPPDLRDFVGSVRRCCDAAGITRRSRDEQQLPRGLWRQLGELGVLGLGTGEGEAAWLAAVFAELGAQLCPGPLAATVMALQLLPLDDAAAVRSGELIVAVGDGAVFPWGMDADVLVGIAADAAWLVDPASPRHPMATLGREPWARVEAAPLQALVGGRTAASTGDLAVASLLLGAAQRLVEMSAEHARTRHQFGSAIGGFQAVAFPLAAVHAALHNASSLLRAAARMVDGGGDARAVCAAARTVAAEAALEAARAAHQVHGATGFTEESPVAAYSTRIRQWTLLPLDGASRRAALLAGIGAHDCTTTAGDGAAATPRVRRHTETEQ